MARRREEYVGEWLPEPLLTSPDVAADVELAESVSIAMLTVLETLAPAERAVFVLREVFDTPYEEIAEAVGKSPAAVRQIAHRARDHVEARRPRMPVSTTEQQEVVERFLAAVRHGDLQGLLDVLAPDVVIIADGGGLVAAARRPIEGAEQVATFLSRAARIADVETTAIWLNGSPGVRIDIGGELDTAVSVAVEDGRITRIYAIRNPHKLARLDGVSPTHPVVKSSMSPASSTGVSPWTLWPALAIRSTRAVGRRRSSSASSSSSTTDCGSSPRTSSSGTLIRSTASHNAA